MVSTSFADIFKSNSLKNGLLPIVVDKSTHSKLFAVAEADEAASVTVDLAAQKLTLPDGTGVDFRVDPFSRHCLMEGIDELGYIQQHEAQIAAYEKSRTTTLNTLAAQQ